MPRFVLEIGTEEIPPRFFPSALSQLKSDGEAMLERARLSFRPPAIVYGTPRRLALIVEDMAAVQAPDEGKERGPAVKIAFDAQGKPTKAAIGFARRHGLAPEDLVRRQTDQGEYVFAVIHEPEAPAKEALAALLPDLIIGLSFPKSMRWGAGTIRFGRPVRWLMALVDDEVVEFSLAELTSGRLTRGHPTLADGMFAVKHAADYERALEERFVIVEPQQRWDEIVRQVMSLAGREGAVVDCPIQPWGYTFSQLLQRPETFAREMEIDLSVQVAFGVELPAAGVGKFTPEFLSLPRPVLRAEMIDVQNYFPLRDKDSQEKLLPGFIAVRDGGFDHLETVIAGWENVLRAKLTDAKYFYEQDSKVSLVDRVDALKDVVFSERVGTMYDKMERIRAIASDLADQLRLSKEQRDWLDRAAYLCKADLTTEMVTELSHLEGVMGGEYARRIEPKEVALAIADHYRPRYAGDDTPDTTIGTFLALADKVDTITAYFAAGVVPSGSADPYGLRREGTGTVRLLVEGRWPPDIAWGLSGLTASQLARTSLDRLHQQVQLVRPADEVVADVAVFLGQRLAAYLKEKGTRYDLVDAALSVGFDQIRQAAQRAEALVSAASKDEQGFRETVIAAIRVANITKGFDGGTMRVDKELLHEDAELRLWAAFKAADADASKLRGGRGAYDEVTYYRDFLSTLTTLREPINRFFDDVLVMAEDEKIRSNRLALCWQITQLFRKLADFTLVVQA